MCSFSIILTCFHYLNFIISTAILCYSYCYVQVSDLILCISALISHIFLISTQISCILKLTSCIPTLILQIFFIPFPNFPFQLLERERERQRQRKRETKRERERERATSICNLSKFIFRKQLLQFKSKHFVTLSYCCITISIKLLFTSSMKLSVISTKITCLKVAQVKTLDSVK